VTFPFASLPENLAAFCAMLRRDCGYRAGPRELQDAIRAIEAVGLGGERVVRDALRPVLAGRVEEARVFDLAFERFFRSAGAGPPARETPGRFAGHDRGTGRPLGARATVEESPDQASDARAAGTGNERPVRGVATGDDETPAGLLRASYSPFEGEGHVRLEPAARAWRDAAALLVSRVRAARSRRWRPAPRGHQFDFRRTLRSSLHTAGEVVLPRYRARPQRHARFVLLIDGSRSMDTHTRAALQMAVALSSVTLDVQAFTFSTSLRRITPDVRRAAAGEHRLLQLHEAWGGGTTIGACLHELLRRYGDRVLGRETVVIITSDGLDVGELPLLRAAMARLARLSAGIIWVNPLLETPRYQPTAGGMRVARPFVSALAAVDDPADLVRLARTLRLR
jgi:uncharacterized protein